MQGTRAIGAILHGTARGRDPGAPPPGTGGTPGRQTLRFIEARHEEFRRTERFRAFYEGLSELEAARVERLWGAMRALVGGRRREAQDLAEPLARGLADDIEGGGGLVLRTFADAILARGRGDVSGSGNLYLEARPPGAQLRAFELLSLRSPLVNLAYAVANRGLLQRFEGRTDVTLVDIGIGRGAQIAALLRDPAARRLLRSLHVIGIEPDSARTTGSDALEHAEMNVLEAAAQAGIPASFTGIAERAERVTAADLLAARPRGLVLGVATLSLHHLPRTDGEEGRDRVLRTLRAVGARALVVVEPDSNHHTDDPLVRFLHAYRHYRAVAQGLHAQLAHADAQLVFSEFYAPEVQNVIAHEREGRTERHEETSRWCERLEAAGFRVDAVADPFSGSGATTGFALRARGRAFSIVRGDVAVVSVMRARA